MAAQDRHKVPSDFTPSFLNKIPVPTRSSFLHDERGVFLNSLHGGASHGLHTL